MKEVLVTGATGFVGSHLCKELHNYGYRVRAMRRGKSNLRNLRGLETEIVDADIEDEESLAKAMAGVQTVFHLAALYRQAKFPNEMYWKINFEGTKKALTAAKKAGVRNFIYCSTIGVHSHIVTPPANESEPYAPTDVYQESKAAAEKFVLKSIRDGEIQGCVIRPAMVWGPGDTRFLKLFRGILRRAFPIIGSGKYYCHWILVTDLVRAFRLAAENPCANGQVYIIAGQRPVTLEYTMQSIAQTYGVKLLPFKVPALPFQLVGSFVEFVCRPLGIEPPIHRRRADFFIKNRAFDCRKAREELGFLPTFTFEEEVKLVAQYYLQSGMLQ